MEIRSANPSDLNELVRVERSCFSKERYSRQVLRSLLSGEEFRTFLATEGEEIRGAITVLFSELFKQARLVSVATMPDHRNQGIAKALLKKVEDEAAVQGMKFISLEVNPTNIAALNLYLHDGFEVKGTIADYYGKSKDAFYMEKPLGDRSSH